MTTIKLPPNAASTIMNSSAIPVDKEALSQVGGLIGQLLAQGDGKAENTAPKPDKEPFNFGFTADTFARIKQQGGILAQVFTGPVPTTKK